MTRSEAETEARRLRDLVRRYEHEYHVLSRPSVSDAEYDRLFDRLLALETEFPDLQTPDSPTLRVGSDLTSELPEVEHTVPVLSLDKAYSAEDVAKWIDRTAASAGGELSFVVEEKIDGISIVLYYRGGVLERAVTRGNGTVGNDVTPNVRTIRSVPLRLTEAVDIAVRGEIFLPIAKFHEINRTLDEPYANPRNFAAGTVRRIKSTDVASVPLEIYVYEAYLDGMRTHVEALRRLSDLGFRLNPRTGYFSPDATLPEGLDHVTVGRFDDLPDYIRRSTSERASLPYEIDGLVVKVDELSVRERLGYTGHHPRWAVAFKFESPEGMTVVEAIDVQVGRTGRITPVARVIPVAIGGTTISNVTLHNQEYVSLLELAIGDGVVVSRRGDVIPAVERVVEKNETGNTTWTMPEACPSCGTGLELRGAHHFCPNRGCPDQVRGRLFFFVGRDQMDINNLGPETIDVLVREGLVEDVPDLYTFDPSALEGVPGFGERKIELIRSGIERSRERPYSAVLPALGIPELGPKVTELLIADGIRNIDDLIAVAEAGDVDRLVSIDGIGEKTARRVVAELTDPVNRDRISRLRKAGLRFEAGEIPETPADDRFAGQVWCVTGSFEHFAPRDLAMAEVEKRGGRTTGSVSGKTTHLLAGTGAGSKLEKARELGVTIVTEEEFLEMIGDSA